ncbi:hypothetical protein [Streptomyces sp. NRRL B-3648]|nr:hypothetical protein [Streptomyces sp. NRRL B-3648]
MSFLSSPLDSPSFRLARLAGAADRRAVLTEVDNSVAQGKDFQQ